MAKQDSAVIRGHPVLAELSNAHTAQTAFAAEGRREIARLERELRRLRAVLDDENAPLVDRVNRAARAAVVFMATYTGVKAPELDVNKDAGAANSDRAEYL